MKSPVVLVTAAVGVLALGMPNVHAAPLRNSGMGEHPVAASGARSAAPSADSNARVAGRPDGEALVRIDGGTAYTRKTGKHSYKFLVPDGANITWFGEVSGKGLVTGSFSRSGLVKGWTRLGHRAGVGVAATLAWGDQASLARVSDPRVNAEGMLVFKASTRQPLPKKLPSFSLNITRATKTVRAGGYPNYFDPLYLSSSMRVQASAGGDYSASVAFQQLNSDGTWSNCKSSTNPGEVPINPNPYNFPNGKKNYQWGPTTCGGVSFVASAPGPGGTYVNALTWLGTKSGGYSYAQIKGEFALAGNFTYLVVLGQWAYGTGGAPACPINGSTCP